MATVDTSVTDIDAALNTLQVNTKTVMAEIFTSEAYALLQDLLHVCTCMASCCGMYGVSDAFFISSFVVLRVCWFIPLLFNMFLANSVI